MDEEGSEASQGEPETDLQSTTTDVVREDFIWSGKTFSRCSDVKSSRPKWP